MWAAQGLRTGGQVFVDFAVIVGQTIEQQRRLEKMLIHLFTLFLDFSAGIFQLVIEFISLFIKALQGKEITGGGTGGNQCRALQDHKQGDFSKHGRSL